MSLKNSNESTCLPTSHVDMVVLLFKSKLIQHIEVEPDTDTLLRS